MTHAFIRGSAAVLTLLLAACAERAPTHGAVPRFQLIPVNSAEAQLPVRPAIKHYGPATLTVSLQGVLPSNRRVLATIADVEAVKVTVRFESGNDMIELVEEVDREALAAGQTSVTFSGLPVGGVWIQIDT
ncbi:MAG: hypothetical protein ACLGIN_12385, partial [Candidatus Sericytochromatia bacterium]